MEAKRYDNAGDSFRKKDSSKEECERLHTRFREKEEHRAGSNAYHCRECRKNAMGCISSKESLEEPNEAAHKAKRSNKSGDDIREECRGSDRTKSDKDGKKAPEKQPWFGRRLQSCGSHRFLFTINALGPVGTIVFARVVVGIIAATATW